MSSTPLNPFGGSSSSSSDSSSSSGTNQSLCIADSFNNNTSANATPPGYLLVRTGYDYSVFDVYVTPHRSNFGDAPIGFVLGPGGQRRLTACAGSYTVTCVASERTSSTVPVSQTWTSEATVATNEYVVVDFD